MSDQEPIFHQIVEYLGKNHDNASGKSDKFYEVTVTPAGNPDFAKVYGMGNFVETRRWGKYGAKGQTKVVWHLSEWVALQSAKAQIKAKMSKGYTRPVNALTRLASIMED